MKASGVALVLVLIWTTGFAGSAVRTATPRPTLAPSPPAKPVAAKAKAHGIALSGRISRVDPVKKIFGVRDAAGREIPLSWTAATKVTGGELKVGATRVGTAVANCVADRRADRTVFAEAYCADIG